MAKSIAGVETEECVFLPEIYQIYLTHLSIYLAQQGAGLGARARTRTRSPVCGVLENGRDCSAENEVSRAAHFYTT